MDVLALIGAVVFLAGMFVGGCIAGYLSVGRHHA